MTCVVHKHRDAVPIDAHHVWPLGEGGPDSEENIILVCPNGHRRIHDYLRLLKRYNGSVPWVSRRLFGRAVKAYAVMGYESIRTGMLPP